jgi:DNA repair exonuclease SbcCD ATPase subunit
MKFVFVEVAGFRGFKDKTRFEFPAGFSVLTGRNGSGKSTVLDAVDFVLTGTINKYAVKGAKGGGLDDHIWWVGEGAPESEHVTVGFVDENGEEFVLTRTRERGLELGEDIIGRFCIGESPAETWADTLIQTSLIRDESIAALSLDLPEQARFAAVRAAIGGLMGTSHAKRTSALVSAAMGASSVQQRRVVDTQAELGQALRALTEARSVVEREADLVEAGRIIRSLVPELPEAPEERLEVLRRHIADRKQAASQLNELVARAEMLRSRQLTLQSDSALVEVRKVHAEYEAAQQAEHRAREILTRAQQLEAAERGKDSFVTHMIELLDQGEALGLQDGHCPLCKAARTAEDFASAIAATRASLEMPGVRVARAAVATNQARQDLEQAEAARAIAKKRVESIENQSNELAREGEALAAMLEQLNLTISAWEPDTIRESLFKKQDEAMRLEHALFTLEASSAHDRVTALEIQVTRLRELLDEETAKLSSTQRAGDVAKQIDDAAREIPNQVMTEQFDTVMPLLKELYQRLRPHTDWQEIEIDFGGRIRASLNFTVGAGRNPQFLFSSGQRRAAGLAFLLAIHLSRSWCRLNSLLLDDPVQHIDDYRALNLVEVLSAVRRTGRQVIVAVEDPALADVLCRRLRSTALEPGRRFDLNIAKNGSAAIEQIVEVFPLPREVLKAAEA